MPAWTSACRRVRHFQNPIRNPPTTARHQLNQLMADTCIASPKPEVKRSDHAIIYWYGRDAAPWGSSRLRAVVLGDILPPQHGTTIIPCHTGRVIYHSRHYSVVILEILPGSLLKDLRDELQGDEAKLTTEREKLGEEISVRLKLNDCSQDALGKTKRQSTKRKRHSSTSRPTIAPDDDEAASSLDLIMSEQDLDPDGPMDLTTIRRDNRNRHETDLDPLHGIHMVNPADNVSSSSTCKRLCTTTSSHIHDDWSFPPLLTTSATTQEFVCGPDLPVHVQDFAGDASVSSSTTASSPFRPLMMSLPNWDLTNSEPVYLDTVQAHHFDHCRLPADGSSYQRHRQHHHHPAPPPPSPPRRILQLHTTPRPTQISSQFPPYDSFPHYSVTYHPPPGLLYGQMPCVPSQPVSQPVIWSEHDSHRHAGRPVGSLSPPTVILDRWHHAQDYRPSLRYGSRVPPADPELSHDYYYHHGHSHNPSHQQHHTNTTFRRDQHIDYDRIQRVLPR